MTEITQNEIKKLNEDSKNIYEKPNKYKKKTRMADCARGGLSGVPICKEKIKEAIMKSRGNLTKAAISLKCSRTTIQNACKSNPDVQLILEEARERTIDAVEDTFLDKCIAGDTTSNIFFLKTRARHRGYDQDYRADVEAVTRAALDFALNKSRNPAEKNREIEIE